ncbi:cation diffusion facilitator family transporter [Alistipes sp. OttesenSCG-928-B03]|nr:cation diffusion facilitator family transporter [Alistipes sp. OttesenSCG-928-B03]
MAGIALNLVFVAVEFIFGLVIDSVALMSDAGHNLSDVVSLALSLMAFRLAQQKPTARYTYGRKKSTVVVSLANACILLIAVGVIIWESIEKLQHPEPVQGGIIAWVAGVGILINAFTAWLFMRYRKNDLNVRGAFLHMAADALVSVGVLVSGIVIINTGWYVIDPIIGILIAVVILVSTWGLLRDSVRLSLDGVPLGMNTAEIAHSIKDSDERVKEVHHLHVWPLSTTENALTAHVVVDSTADTEALKHKIRERLKGEGIGHSTLEFELPGEKEREGCSDCNG